MFKRNSFMFLDLQVSSVQNKNKAEEKFTVKRWPKKMIGVYHLGLGICQRLWTISCFGYFLKN